MISSLVFLILHLNSFCVTNFEWKGFFYEMKLYVVTNKFFFFKVFSRRYSQVFAKTILKLKLYHLFACLYSLNFNVVWKFFFLPTLKIWRIFLRIFYKYFKNIYFLHISRLETFQVLEFNIIVPSPVLCRIPLKIMKMKTM